MSGWAWLIIGGIIGTLATLAVLEALFRRHLYCEEYRALVKDYREAMKEEKLRR